MPENRGTAPFAAFENDAAFKDLYTLMRSERPPIVLIGAGASISSGYPAWTDLLKNLRDVALRKDKRDWRRSLEDMTDAPWTAELFANRLKPGELSHFIRRSYKSRGIVAEPHIALAQMKFPHFLTTNYDPSIEEALDLAGRRYRRIVWPGSARTGADHVDNESLSEFLIGLGRRDSECRVIYLHGRFDSHEDRIILTESDYVERYIASDDARRKLMAIFMTHPVLFVGFSMSDPDLANLMREVTARLKAKTPCHFALMGYKTEAEREAINARMVGKFGVRPVFFSRTPIEEGADEYSNLSILLDALAHGDGSQKRIASASRSRRALTATFDPDDPNKGMFGGSASRNGRRLSARKKNGSKQEGFLNFEFTVEPIDGAPPLKGGVLFHLHPTFTTDVVARNIRAGKATLTRWAYGAFTIGAVTDDGNTRLELDLAEDATLPLWFRRQ